MLKIVLLEDEELNGLDVEKIIYNINSKIKFIFITGYSQYVLDSFSVHPYDYTLKPINIDKIMQTSSTLANKIELEQNSLVTSNKIIVQNKNETLFISLEEIIFIETQNRGTIIHCGNETYVNHQTLSELEKQLDKNFIKTHKSFIVNKNEIRKIKQVVDRSYEVKFIKTEKIALISRYKFEELKPYLIPS